MADFSEFVETVFAYGHKNILATHETTIEVTKDETVSKRGNCIIAVSASKALADLNENFRSALRRKNSVLTIKIEAGELSDTIKAYGNPKLTLTHPTDMVIRKSSYICDRTLAICADKAANNLSRSLIKALTDPKQKAKLTLTVRV
ncbi:MAG: DUF371 domain-containing protein [Candidatus Bathyarchaeia archaeon]